MKTALNTPLTTDPRIVALLASAGVTSSNTKEFEPVSSRLLLTFADPLPSAATGEIAPDDQAVLCRVLPDICREVLFHRQRAADAELPPLDRQEPTR